MTNARKLPQAPRRARLKTTPWSQEDPATVTVLAGGWIAETMPDACDHCSELAEEQDLICLPFMAVVAEPDWVIADYFCQVCGADWWCGWSTLFARRVALVAAA